jgi:hypothetical protein
MAKGEPPYSDLHPMKVGALYIFQVACTDRTILFVWIGLIPDPPESTANAG